MLLKYAGNGKHVRTISKKDFKSVGFDHPAIHVDVREESLVEVSDDVAEWLLSDESGEKADWTKPTDKEAERFRVRNAPDEDEAPTADTADTAKADKGVDAGAAAGSAVTTGGSNTAKGAGSSS